MKKIALICNTYIRNYGSILQSYATYCTLKSLGYDVDVVNYQDVPRNVKIKLRINWHIRIPMLLHWKNIKKKIQSFVASKKESFRRIKSGRACAMDQFVYDNFSFTKKLFSIDEVRNVIKQYDIVVLGSDQLWGVAEIIRNYHTLNFVPEQMPKITYATSFGVSNLPSFLKKETRCFLNRINSLSVREESGAAIIKSLTGRSAQVVVDPTLLLTESEWNSIVNLKKPYERSYVFCFFLGDNPLHRAFAKIFQQKTGLKIVSMLHLDEFIKDDETFADETFDNASPLDFVNLIKNAEYIICDSFHASVFSIIFRKMFFTLDRYDSKSTNSRNTRIASLFGKLGLENRHITGCENIDLLLQKNIDFDSVHKRLDVWRNESKQYLKNALSLD